MPKDFEIKGFRRIPREIPATDNSKIEPPDDSSFDKEPVTKRQVNLTRERLIGITTFPEEKNIFSKIIQFEKEFDPSRLQVVRIEYDNQGVIFAEYQYPLPPDNIPKKNYIYFNDRCKNPKYLGVTRQKIPLNFRGGHHHQLFRILIGQINLIDSWDDQVFS